MLTEPIKQEIRDVLARISEALPGYKSRPAQRVMIAEVAKILAQVREGDQPKGRDGEGLGILQCGTGVGKSISYLTAALVLAKHKRKTVVISTSTIALQEQLMYRDIPFFLKAAGLAVTPVLIGFLPECLCDAAPGTAHRARGIALLSDALTGCTSCQRRSRA